MAAFRVLPVEAFATLSAALAVSTFAGAVLQFGAAYALPNAARGGPAARDAAFGRLLLRSSAGALVVTAAALSLPMPEFLRFGLLVGAATGVQLVCDSLLRCRAELALLGGLNASLHAGLLVAVAAMAAGGMLTAPAFLAVVFCAKAGFALVVVLRSDTSAVDALRAPPQATSRPATGTQAAVALVCLLGTLDVLLIEARGATGSDYVALRHFGYGLFLLVVQESAMPLLVARVVARGSLSVRGLGLSALALSAAVGAAAVMLATLLSALRGIEGPGAAIGTALFLSLACHSLTVIFVFAAFAFGAWGRRQALLCGCGVALVCGVAAVLPSGRADAVALAAAGLNLLVAVCACADLARTHSNRKAVPC